MNIRTILTALPLLAAVSGCSFLYDLSQDKAQARCDELVASADRAACKRSAGQSYEDYEANRKKAQQGKSP